MATRLAVLLLAIAVVALSSSTIDTSAGDKLYASGQFEQAAAIYSRLLRQSPRDVSLLIRFGATEYELGSFEAAEKSFRTAASLAPELVQAQVGLGTSLLALDRSRDSIPVLERAARLTPSDPMTLRALGHAYQQQNDLFKGERILSSLVSADPSDAESWYYLGALLYDSNYYARSLEAFNHVLQLQTADSHAQVAHVQIYRAGALSQLGRIEEAGNLYGTLISQEAQAARPELWLGYAQFLLNDQQLPTALEAVNRAMALLSDSAKLLYWRARILLDMGSIESAEADARKAVHLSPELPNAHNLLMKIYRLRGSTEAADEQARWLAAHTSVSKAGVR
jgi:tetratricopeptide (TPR) repeat protein